MLVHGVEDFRLTLQDVAQLIYCFSYVRATADSVYDETNQRLSQEHVDLLDLLEEAAVNEEPRPVKGFLHDSHV